MKTEIHKTLDNLHGSIYNLYQQVKMKNFHCRWKILHPKTSKFQNLIHLERTLSPGQNIFFYIYIYF